MNQTRLTQPIHGNIASASLLPAKSFLRTGLVAACVAALFSNEYPVYAQVVFDGFSGSGALVGSNGGSGWAGPWQSNALGVTTTIGGSGFEYVDAGGHVLVTSPGAGSIASAPTSGNRFHRAFSSTLGSTSGTAYISFLAQFDGTQSTATEMGFSLLRDGGFDTITLIKPYSWANRLVVYDERASAVVNNVIAPINPTLERLYVMRLDLGGGTAAGTSRLRLYINPTLDSAALSNPASDLDNLGLFPVSGISFTTRGLVSAFRFDEIRVGTTLTEVLPFTAVPEPASTAFASGILISALGIWRARSRTGSTPIPPQLQGKSPS